MDDLLANEEGRGSPRIRQSISGFRGMKQKTQLMGRRVSAGCRLMFALSLVTVALTLVAPVVSAADPYSRGVQARSKAVPAPRVQPTPRLDTTPRTGRDLGAGSSTDFYNRAGSASACRSRCGSSCQTISCSGLNSSQCLSIRQQCRMGCSTRC